MNRIIKKLLHSNDKQAALRREIERQKKEEEEIKAKEARR